jgi:hypothetical protein
MKPAVLAKIESWHLTAFYTLFALALLNFLLRETPHDIGRDFSMLM